MNPEFNARIEQKLMWRLTHDAGTIACVIFAPTRAPMLHILKNGQCIGNYLVGFIALNVCNKPNATRVTLKFRRVKSFSCHIHLFVEYYLKKIATIEIFIKKWQAFEMKLRNNYDIYRISSIQIFHKQSKGYQLTQHTRTCCHFC